MADTVLVTEADTASVTEADMGTVTGEDMVMVMVAADTAVDMEADTAAVMEVMPHMGVTVMELALTVMDHRMEPLCMVMGEEGDHHQS